MGIKLGNMFINFSISSMRFDTYVVLIQKSRLLTCSKVVSSFILLFIKFLKLLLLSIKSH